MPDTQTRTSKGARGSRSGGDARREPEKQKENQKRLRVGPVDLLQYREQPALLVMVVEYQLRDVHQPSRGEL